MAPLKGFIDLTCENCDNGSCHEAQCRRVIAVGNIIEIQQYHDRARLRINEHWIETRYTIDQLITMIKAAT